MLLCLNTCLCGICSGSPLTHTHTTRIHHKHSYITRVRFLPDGRAMFCTKDGIFYTADPSQTPIVPVKLMSLPNVDNGGCVVCLHFLLSLNILSHSLIALSHFFTANEKGLFSFQIDPNFATNGNRRRKICACASLSLVKEKDMCLLVKEKDMCLCFSFACEGERYVLVLLFRLCTHLISSVRIRLLLRVVRRLHQLCRQAARSDDEPLQIHGP